MTQAETLALQLELLTERGFSTDARIIWAPCAADVFPTGWITAQHGPGGAHLEHTIQVYGNETISCFGQDGLTLDDLVATLISEN